MNALIAALTLFNLFHWTRDQKLLSKGSWALIFAGTLLPLLDYIAFLTSSEPGLFWMPLWFHSPFYLAALLSVISLWVWIGTRNLKRATQVFWPLAGLGVYLLLSLISTQRLPFLRPFSDFSFSLGLVNQGYLVVLSLTILLWVTKRWNRLKTITVCKASLAILVGFVLVNGVVRVLVLATLPEEMRQGERVSLQPANWFQSSWHVSSLKRDRYHYADFNLIGGWGPTQMLQSSNDFELTQTLLLDPYFKSLYVHGFKNPVVETKYINDLLRVQITELWPLREVYWTRLLTLTKTSSGQILEIEREKGYLF
ncbi:MAG: hypothetical protein RRB13_10165 [bacterium]|nr:hypothetical protein [bacterium]